MKGPGVGPWELGSDFDWDSSQAVIAPVDGERPWCRDDEPVAYVESGRQALALLSQHLRSRGFQDLVFPGHFCESMVTPFLADGWNVKITPVADDWTIVPPTWGLTHSHRTLIFNVPFFGVGESAAWLDFIKTESARGAVIVSDETHRVLGSGLEAAHFRIGSLRKLLPVPDGAFLVGLGIEGLDQGIQAERRVVAMRAKSRYLSGEGDEGHLQLFAAAEDLTEHGLAPKAMSDSTKRLLDRFDYPKMAHAREANAAALNQGLMGSGYEVTTTAAQIPSHAVIRGNGVGDLRQHLIAHSIYCPVHWPRPHLNESELASDWRTDILSIPVDHRYSQEDMQTVVRAVNEFTLQKSEAQC